MKRSIPRSSTAYRAPSVPFTTESEVRNFIEKYAENILGLTVISSDRSGGGRLFDIDILAVDAANTPFIIECKWDLVGERAFRQLAQYKEALLAGWSSFRERVRHVKGEQVQIRKRDPVLIAIGYRYEPAVLSDPQSVVCLTYAYHRLVLTDEVVERYRPGKVSIQRADPALMPSLLHPRVTKRFGSVKSIGLLPRALQTAFYKIDERIRRLAGVTVVYGGRTLARYRVPRSPFAEATVQPHSIQWSFAKTKTWAADRLGGVEMLAARDMDKIFNVLHGAYVRQPNKAER